MRVLRGLTLESLKKSPEVSPLFLIFIVGTGLSSVAFLRFALFHPDLTYNHLKNPEPFEYYRDKKYKLTDHAFDHDKKSPAPIY